ncbi:hypothetical protein IFM89_015756 [Coptis chinensis]|uniref:R13L1/DRL21-like LRR repeat region domain-containing protein n=1 Tax=Coptis chinensis TaxID=261450 RepID=A0A835HF22_9MAGN|nr:hypothetical protein IFM89_015756 [Coptis chinensis]
MTNLRGSLRIVKLENALSVEDAEEVALYDKPYLHKLELQWSYPCLEAVDVLEGLEPHRNLSLHVGEMDTLKKVDAWFCGGGRTKGFPKLETLNFDRIPSLEEWTAVEENAMSCLHRLTIVDCPNLVKLPEISNLKSLQHFEIILCFKLPSFSEKRLPASLQTLVITDCPELSVRCQREGIDWPQISDVPNIWIDYKKISMY